MLLDLCSGENEGNPVSTKHLRARFLHGDALEDVCASCFCASLLRIPTAKRHVTYRAPAKPGANVKS